jgi:hypothetical protein
VTAAQDHLEELEREARRAEVSGDPLGTVLRVLASSASAIDRSMAEVLRLVDPSRQPVSKEVVRQAVAEATRFVTLDVVRAFNRRTIAAAAAVMILLMAGSFGAGYWVHGDRLMIAGLRAGDDTCRPQSGGVLCYIPIWKTLPASPGNK